MPPDTFDKLFASLPWQAIRGCPGRFRLAELSAQSPGALVGRPGAAVRAVLPSVDPVWILNFPGGGGLLSYEKPDGRFLHTLNTPNGFDRKSQQLGLPPERLRRATECGLKRPVMA